MTEVRVDESYRVALPEFEGPLDLLLHLCKTHEIEIVNIPIAFITEKYLEYLDVMQTLSVDLAADYLVMAATLAYLKSRELVPTPEALEATEEEGDEEVVDPREELIRRLLEYQKYKNAAALLGDRPIEGRNIFGRGMDIEDSGGPTPLADHSAWKLIEAFAKLLEKAGPKNKIAHEVFFDRVSISARINQLIDRLEGKGAVRFDELFDMKLPEAELRSQLVVTLLAMLELARLRVVRVLASSDGETLVIAQVEGAALTEARRAKASSDAESVLAGEEHEGATPVAAAPFETTPFEGAAAEAVVVIEDVPVAAAAEIATDESVAAVAADEGSIGEGTMAAMGAGDEIGSADAADAEVPEASPSASIEVASAPGSEAPVETTEPDAEVLAEADAAMAAAEEVVRGIEPGSREDGGATNAREPGVSEEESHEET